MRRCLLAVFIICLMPVWSQAAPDRPNVLIVTVDDMNADSIGAYGCSLPNISPNMDRLVKSGLRFAFAHVQVGNCMPGRNVMWSGCYPHNNAVEGFYQVKQPPQPHLVDVMKSAGYFTAISGKTSPGTKSSTQIPTENRTTRKIRRTMVPRLLVRLLLRKRLVNRFAS